MQQVEKCEYKGTKTPSSEKAPAGYASLISNILFPLWKRISLIGASRKWIDREIKLKGIIHIPDLIKLFNDLVKEKLIYTTHPLN